MKNCERVLPLVGRALLSQIFVLSALNKLNAWNQTASYMSSKGMPLVPLLLAAAIVLEFFGGLGILLGYRTQIAAGALFLFLIPTTLIFHNFWVYEGFEQQVQMAMFQKNLAIMGGLALLAGAGAGPLSLDSRHRTSNRPISPGELAQ